MGRGKGWEGKERNVMESGVKGRGRKGKSGWDGIERGGKGRRTWSTGKREGKGSEAKGRERKGRRERKGCVYYIHPCNQTNIYTTCFKGQDMD